MKHGDENRGGVMRIQHCMIVLGKNTGLPLAYSLRHPTIRFNICLSNYAFT